MKRLFINKKLIIRCVLIVTLIFEIMFLLHRHVSTQKKRRLVQHLVKVISDMPTFPKPIRVSSTETNYCRLLLTIDEATDSESVSADDIIQAISGDMMQRYVSPLVETGNYRGLPNESVGAVALCGQVLFSNIVVTAPMENGENTLDLLCARLHWIINGLRNENQSWVRCIAIGFETDVTQWILKDNLKSMHTILPLLPFTGMDYLPGTCELLSSEIMEQVDFSYRDYDGKKEQVKRSLQPIFDRLTSLPLLIGNDDNKGHLEQVVADLKRDLQASALTDRDKKAVVSLFDRVLSPDLHLSHLKQKIAKAEQW